MRKYRPLIILFIIVMIGIILNPFGLLGPVKDYGNTLVSPVTRGLSRTTHGAQNFFHTMFSLSKIMDENSRLKNNNIKLESDNIRLKETQHENAILKQELKFSQSTNLQLIAANIIAKSPSGLIDSVIINKGLKDGIKENQAIVSQGFLIGRVHNVYRQTSQVVLITSNSSKVPGYLQDSRGIGIVQGGLKGLSIDDIPLDITPKKREVVLSSDIGNIIPRGIPIGYIKEINFTQSDISHSATIESPIEFSHLEMVFVVK